MLAFDCSANKGAGIPAALQLPQQRHHAAYVPGMTRVDIGREDFTNGPFLSEIDQKEKTNSREHGIPTVPGAPPRLPRQPSVSAVIAGCP